MESHAVEEGPLAEVSPEGIIEVAVAPAANQSLTISVFANARDRSPKVWSGSFERLYDEQFRTHEQRQSKDGPAWSPATFAAGSTRGNKNVEAICALVADVDDGAGMEEMHRRLEGVAYIIHTSFSHTPDHPKYRIIVPLIEHISAAQHATIWPRFNELLGGHLDPATRDPARIYYLPAHPPGAEGHLSELHPGRRLAITDLPAGSVPDQRSETLYSRAPARRESRASLPTRQDEASPLPDGIFSKEGIEQMYRRCPFIAYVTNPAVQASVEEPAWRAMLSNHAPFKEGDERAHEGSRHHPDYTAEETQEKLIEVFTILEGPITCRHIRTLGLNKCPPKHNCLAPFGYAHHPADLGEWVDFRYTAPLPPIVQGHEFLRRTVESPTVCVNNEFLVYREGYYRPIAEAQLREALLDQTGPSVQSKRLAEVEGSLRTLAAAQPEDFSANRHLICCTNGTLNVQTLELLPHSPGHMLRTGLKVPYDPGAQCPHFLSFLHDVFRDDEDRDERIAFLQQWFGYLLVPTARLQLMLWLVGAGANGKSILLEIMRQLVGVENCSTVMLDRLASGAVRAELDGKALNISSDLPRNTAINDGYMKACVAGDPIDGERKFKAPFTFRPTLKFVASMNNMPHTNDLSHGFFRRIVVLQFERIFAPEEQDHGLLDRLMAELPGILAWAVEGLRLLGQTWRIPIPPSSRTAVGRYAAESNPVALFAEECLEVGAEADWVNASRVFEAFQAWCRANGFQARSIVTFAREMGQLGYAKRKRSVQQWQVRLKSVTSGMDMSVWGGGGNGAAEQEPRYEF